MSPLFNYQHIQVNLHKETRSMGIELKLQGSLDFLNEEMIDELEELFNWLTGHLEIQSVHLFSSTGHFGRGINLKRYTDSENSQQEVLSLLTRVRSLTRAMIFLPQVFIVDYGSGAEGASFELGIGADLRVAQEEAHFSLSMGNKGLMPMSGGLSLLTEIVGPSLCRKWNLLNNISKMDLEISGYISLFYQSQTQIDFLKKSIKSISPTARVQMKGCLLQSQLERLEKNFQLESNYGQALLMLEDWKKYQSEDNDGFQSITEVANILSENRDEIYQV